MGFSVSASTAIIFAGLFLAFGMLYPAMSNSYERVQDAQFDRDGALLEERNTDIELESASNEEIRVINTGSTSLKTTEVDLVLNGEYQPRETIDVSVDGADGSELWLPGETLVIESAEINSDDRFVVITKHGLRIAGEV